MSLVLTNPTTPQEVKLAITLETNSNGVIILKYGSAKVAYWDNHTNMLKLFYLTTAERKLLSSANIPIEMMDHSYFLAMGRTE